MRGGNAYFIKNAKGNIVLMAENIKEHDRPRGRSCSLMFSAINTMLPLAFLMK